MFFQSSLFVKEISGNCMLLFLRVNIGFLFSGIHSVFCKCFFKFFYVHKFVSAVFNYFIVW